MSNWRKYTFFDKDTISENLYESLGANVTAAVSEGGILAFGDEKGVITLSSHGQKPTDTKDAKPSFRGQIIGLFYLFDSKNPTKQFVIALGYDSVDSNNSTLVSTIKTFNATDLNRPIQSFSGGFTNISAFAKPTAFAVSSDGTQIAVGYSNGAVILFIGAFLKESTANRGIQSQILLSDYLHPVTGLYFCEVRVGKSPGETQIRLFTVFDTDIPVSNDQLLSISASTMQEQNLNNDEVGGILVFDVSTVQNAVTGNVNLLSNRQPQVVLDERGAAKLCSCYSKETKELVIGRNEGIFSYSVEYRGGASAFEGDKMCVCAVGRYILVVSLDDKSRRSNVTIYDLRNRFISFSGQIAAGEKIVSVTNDKGMAYILTSSQILLRYRERDTASKVDVLLKKSLYPLAISLATEEQSDISEIMKLFKLYGDHLYKKGDFDGAMNQYLSTIGYLQSSYVIRQYLDPHRIYSLIVYLEKIQDKGLAIKEHKTLLLSCYTKIKDDDKIKRFLSLYTPSSAAPVAESLSSPTVSSGKPLTKGFSSTVTVIANEININKDLGLNYDGTSDAIDAEGCVEVLKEAGFIDYALQLAASFSLHELYLDMQLNRQADSGINACIVYLTYLSLQLQQDLLLPLLLVYLPKILILKPNPCTGLLVKLCRGDSAGLVSTVTSTVATATITTGSNDVSSATSFIHERIASSAMKADNFIPIPIEDVFPIFIDHDEQLKGLIEGVYDNNNKGFFHQCVLPTYVINTLLELYLEDYKKLKSMTGKTDTDLRAIEVKIMSLLDGHASEYDLDRAMLLMHSFQFELGAKYLMERNLSTDLLVRMGIETQRYVYKQTGGKTQSKDDERTIMKILRKEGGKGDSELYIQVLTYYVMKSMQSNDNDINKANNNDDDEDDERWDDITEVLTLIEKESVLTPTQVIAILSQNPQLPLHIVSNYILKTIQDVTDDNDELQNNVTTMMNTITSIQVEEQAKKQHGSLGTFRKIPLSSKKPSNKKKAVDNSNSNPLSKKGNKISIGGGKNNSHAVDDDTEDDEDELHDEFAEYEEDEDEDYQLVHHERVVEKKKWESIKKAQLERSSDHEGFYAELEHSVDGFATVAAYFGKTVVFEKGIAS